MKIEDATGAFLILVPIAFNAFFFLLARLFDYPDIVRSPTASILSRYRAGGVRLKLVWYGFMLAAILLAPLAVLMGQVLARDGRGCGGSRARRFRSSSRARQAA